MSEVAHCAFALVPSESNFEGLTKRLLALRAEIDAILADLASQAMALPHRTAAMTAEPALALSPPVEMPTADAEQDMLQIPADLPDDGQAKLEAVMVEEADTAPELSIDDSGAIELLEPMEIVAAADIDTDAAGLADDDALFAEAEVAPIEIAVPPQAAPAEQQDDAAMLDAPQPSPHATGSEDRPQQQAAPVIAALSAVGGAQTGDRPVTAAADSEEALADAAVIPLHARQRKHKGTLAAGAQKRVRSGRYLAAKIAACILVLLTAATLLVMADRTALGSVPSLSWMSQTPAAPTSIDWLWQRIKAGAAQVKRNAASAADVQLDDGPFAGLAWGA